MAENDPTADEERREIRKKYRNLIEDLQQNAEELTNPESDELHERLNEAEELFKPVKTTREVVLDSQTMSIIADFGRRKAEALHTEFIRFQPVEFAEKLITFIGGQPLRTHEQEARISALGWARLGEGAQPFFKRSPFFDFMAGSFERGERVVKERQRAAPREKDTEGKATVPKQLKDFTEMEKKEATTEEVEKVFDILKNIYLQEDKNPLCFFEFVINPDSFGMTVENIFHVSFLVRDGRAKILLDVDGLPTIRPVEDNEKQLEGEQKRHQTLISITPGQWREIVNTFQIEVPAIPPRASLDENSNG